MINMDDYNLRGIPVKCNQVTVKKRKQIIKSEQLKLNTCVHFIFNYSLIIKSLTLNVAFPRESVVHVV